jgi:hypothetical protein
MPTEKQMPGWSFRPYKKVLLWWSEFNRDGHWKRNQALNLGLAKFMNKGDKELEELYKEMRGNKDDNESE